MQPARARDWEMRNRPISSRELREVARAAAATLLEEAVRIGRALGDDLHVVSLLGECIHIHALRQQDRRQCSRCDGHERDDRPSNCADSKDASGLTPRELEILALVAQGMTNKAIAARLVLSVPTVQTHVSNLYAKLGVHSRSAATAYALTRSLAQPAGGR